MRSPKTARDHHAGFCLRATLHWFASSDIGNTSWWAVPTRRIRSMWPPVTPAVVTDPDHGAPASTARCGSAANLRVSELDVPQKGVHSVRVGAHSAMDRRADLHNDVAVAAVQDCLVVRSTSSAPASR